VKKKIAALAVAATLMLGMTACGGSDAKTVSDNISKEADQFNVQRKITGVNGITDKVAFEVEGRCSIEPQDRKLMVICKHGDNDYRKHYVGLSDNTYWVSEQLDGIDVSRYHTTIVVRPEALIPEFKVEAGKQ
jgi:hypothetical protein